MHTPMRMPVPCTRAILPSRALLAWVCPLHLRGPSRPAWCALLTCRGTWCQARALLADGDAPRLRDALNKVLLTTDY